MKKTILCSVIFCGFLLTGCGDNNKEYYLKNIDSAKEKLTECETKLMQAISESDLKKVQDDTECTAASDAIKENARIEREKVRQERQERQKAELLAVKEEVNKEFASQSWQEYIVSYANSKCPTTFISLDKKCTAMKELYHEKVAEGQTELSKIPFVQLNLEEDKYCSKDKGQYSICQVWKDTTKKQEQNIVESYIQDYAKLKTDYNMCFITMQEAKKLKSINSRELIDIISNNYPYKQIRYARVKLNLGDGFDQKME